MTRDDVAAFANELTVTAEVFGAVLSDARIGAYYHALEDVPWPELQMALAAARQVERFFPTPAALRELLEPSLEVAAADAFVVVWECVAGRRPRTDLDIVDRSVVQAMGGWGTFLEAKEATGGILAAQFRKLYLAYAKHERIEEAKHRALPAAARPMLERQP